MQAMWGRKSTGKYSGGGITFQGEKKEKKSAALQSSRLCYTNLNSFSAHVRDSGLLFDFYLYIYFLVG